MPPLAEIISTIHQHTPWFWPLVGGALGAVLGSFATCLVYRWPRGLSMRQPPSYCPSCRTRLGIPDLVPIVSWLALRGHCRHCQASIPWRSLLLECLSAAIGAGAVWILLPHLIK